MFVILAAQDPMREPLRVAGDDRGIQAAVGGDHRRIRRQERGINRSPDQSLDRSVGAANDDRLNVESLLSEKALPYSRPERTVSGRLGRRRHGKCDFLLRGCGRDAARKKSYNKETFL